MVDLPQPAPLAGAVHQHLRDGQADQFGVADPGWPAAPLGRVEQVVDEHGECDDEVVEGGAHEVSKADVADATPTLDDLASSPKSRPCYSESLI